MRVAPITGDWIRTAAVIATRTTTWTATRTVTASVSARRFGGDASVYARAARRRLANPKHSAGPQNVMRPTPTSDPR